MPRKRPPAPITAPSPPQDDDWVLLDPPLMAKDLGISEPSLWRLVADGTYPAPIYVGPRKPKFIRSELRTAAMSRRYKLGESKVAARLIEARKKAKAARDAAAAAAAMEAAD